MTLNFPGPYEFRYIYTVDTTPGGLIQHECRFSAELVSDPPPGALFTTFSVKLSGGGTLIADTVANNTVNVLEDMFNSADAIFVRVELWKYTQGTFQAIYVTAKDLALPGTSATATNPAGESIFTFRTKAGGIFKIALQDTVGDYGTKVSYADANPIAKALMDYFKSSTLAPYVGRDGSYPFLPLHFSPGQNEYIFKKRYGR